MIDWDDAFDNSGYVPGSDRFRALWSEKAEAFRAQHSFGTELGVPYGPHEREAYDAYHPDGAAKGTLIFVHGGYWHLMDRSLWAHLSAGPLSHGWRVVFPSYPLAPEARVSGITQSIRSAVCAVAETYDGPIAITGHSAGGHLATRMLCEGVLPGDVLARVQKVVSISGVHHLQPLLMTRMNDILKLTEEESAEESPVLLTPVQGVPITFWVGADERPEFLRQARIMSEKWGGMGVTCRSVFEEGKNHFDVIDSLADPDGSLTREVMR